MATSSTYPDPGLSGFGPDPYLSAHVVAPALVDLGGKLSPGSIRDQTLRALLVTDALWRQRLLTEGQRLLIVGAGVAGVIAALRASAYGAEVWVVDKESDALSVLAENTVRLVSPTIYDWPSSHCWQTSFGSSPVTYVEETPSRLTDRWLGTLRAAVAARPGLLHFEPKVEYQSARFDGAKWHLSFQPAGDRAGLSPGLTGRPFDLIYSCLGIGAETEGSLPWKSGPADQPFPMFRFWENDCFPHVNHGARFPPQVHLFPQQTQARVVIIGAGDGGLQDFLRFVTGGMPVRDVIESISRTLRRQRDAYRAFYNLFDSDSRTGRHFVCWQHDHTAELLASSHDDCANEIEDLYSNPECQNLLRSALEPLIKFDDILVFHAQPTLGRCYAVNRFLALLFARHLSEYGRHGYPLRFGWTAKHVECVGDHDIESLEPGEHYSGQHLLTLEDAAGASQVIACRAVIPRIGPMSARARELRQTLPFWVPGWAPAKPPEKRVQRRSVRIDLDDDRACRRALWRCIVGMAVIKNARGEVLALNRRFADFIGKPPEKILGSSASAYAGPERGRIVEEHDKLVRTSLKSLFTYSLVGDKPHYTFRFPFPIDENGLGSASIGIDTNDTSLNVDRINDLDEPSPEALERFFEWMPCSIALTDRSHRYLYGNQAFRRVFTPPGSAGLPGVELYHSTWNDILARLVDPSEREDPSDEKKNDTLNTGRSHFWESVPPFGRDRRLVVAFPILDPSGERRAVGSIGVRWGFLESSQKNPKPGQPSEYEIEP